MHNPDVARQLAPAPTVAPAPVSDTEDEHTTDDETQEQAAERQEDTEQLRKEQEEEQERKAEERRREFQRQQEEHEAERARIEALHQSRAATLNRIVENAPVTFNAQQLRLFLDALIDLNLYFAEDVAADRKRRGTPKANKERPTLAANWRTAAFPYGLTVAVSTAIAEPVLALNHDCVLDGEAIGDVCWPFDILSLDGAT